MSPQMPLPQLTPTEMEVMEVLWEEGRLSAREVHDRLASRTGWAYSTTRTTIERMVRKGLLSKAPFHGLHLYEAGISRAAGVARLVRDFAQRVLEASPDPVMALVAERGRLTEAELEELRGLLDTYDEMESPGESS